MVVGQPPEHVHVLADRVRRDHDLDAVVTQPGRYLERVGRPVGKTEAVDSATRGREADKRSATSGGTIYRVGLSRSDLAAFEMATALGYDGVEVMVSTDPVSQDVAALRQLSDYHGVPVRPSMRPAC